LLVTKGRGRGAVDLDGKAVAAAVGIMGDGDLGAVVEEGGGIRETGLECCIIGVVLG
jgi:hypothetical protein